MGKDTSGEIANIDLDLFRRVSMVRARGDVRYYLNAVLVQPHQDGVLAVASDGHRLLVGLDRRGMCARPIIVDLSADAAKGAKQGERLSFVESTVGPTFVQAIRRRPDEIVDKRFGVRNAGDVIDGRLAKLVEGKFPNWVSIITPRKLGKASGFVVNPVYMREMMRAMQFSRFSGVEVLMTDAGANGPIFFIPARANADMELVGIVMPMLFDRSPDLPSWIGNTVAAGHEKPAKQPADQPAGEVTA
ncbi:hypothetical protein [Solimonas marina]|uniref:DNA polymerase III beta sliding clamp central domain-containing protein n=1 Tax=Solimonas marina TaxID=2714601 RepID=A0A969W7S2_9GAMM|nr:hypothetical protein [Solimonas marina]NKF21538.1 hypothetical protein [Solimonas marina]